MNIENAIKQASKFLKKNNIYSFNLDSEILMSRVIKKDRKYLILNLCHHFSTTRSYTSLTIIRDGYGIYTNKK